MSLEAALHLAIREAPDDDAPRLVLADYLMDHDDPALADRGDFLRVQCLLARLAPRDRARQPLLAREEELLERHRTAWLGGAGAAPPGCAFRRGLIHVEPPQATFNQLLAWAATPVGAWLEALVLSSAGTEAVQQLAGAAWLERLTSLAVHRGSWPSLGAGDGAALALAASPHARHLARLDLRDANLGPAGVRALSRGSHLGRLRALRLARNRVGDEGARALASTSCLTGLEHLDLARAEVGAAGVRALAASPQLAGLRRLSLAGCVLGREGAAHLAGASAFPRLSSLDLSDCRIGAPGARALARWPGLRSLTRLELAGNDLGDAGVIALASSPHLNGLRVLHLSDNGIGRAGAMALVDARPLRRLQALTLGKNVLDASSVQPLRLIFGDRVSFTDSRGDLFEAEGGR
jgi:uncharacterized protein (TIGR02996 family)